MNKGMGDSNGDVKINIVSSENLTFEVDYLELGEIDARESMDLGDIAYFQISSSFSGISYEEITVEIYDDDGYVYSEKIGFIIGDTTNFITEDFESNTNWSVGYDGDTATAGVWDLLIPIGTYENNQIVQPDADHSIDGDYCFITQNPADIGSNPGSNDVDGGKTTLLSPIYNLSDYDGAIVSYWKWYSNNQGNNPGTDYWQVLVSSDGSNWVNLENTNVSNSYWN